MSWTGTETRRREQGGCKPPSKSRKQFRVRTGSPCKIRRVAMISNGCGPWCDYITTKNTYFEDMEKPKRYARGRRVFRYGDYELMIEDRYVDLVSVSD